MANTIKFNATFDPSVTTLDIFRSPQGVSIMDTLNLTLIDSIPVTESEYTDETGVVGQIYRVVPQEPV